MPYPQLDRHQVKMNALVARENRKFAESDFVTVTQRAALMKPESAAVLDETLQRIRIARTNRRPVILAFGAHTIKNGLSPILIELLQKGWITHLATNGAGIIHDWEFSYLGASSENVGANVLTGTFGNWQETGFFINLALIVGAYEGKGYGESVGAMIENEALSIPSEVMLKAQIIAALDVDPERAAAAADLLDVVREFQIESGMLSVPHKYKQCSVQAAAYRARVPFTGHPMIGHDIIYNHPMNRGAAVGRTAQRDFLAYAHSISSLEGGVYLSVGSAVMSPMIFEKSLSMSQSLAIQKGTLIKNHFICVVDLAEGNWDWSQGEPPEDNPAYYLRFCKTFNRMGGSLRYLSADNRDFFLALYHGLVITK